MDLFGDINFDELDKQSKELEKVNVDQTQTNIELEVRPSTPIDNTIKNFYKALIEKFDLKFDPEYNYIKIKEHNLYHLNENDAKQAYYLLERLVDEHNFLGYYLITDFPSLYKNEEKFLNVPFDFAIEFDLNILKTELFILGTGGLKDKIEFSENVNVDLKLKTRIKEIIMEFFETFKGTKNMNLNSSIEEESFEDKRKLLQEALSLHKSMISEGFVPKEDSESLLIRMVFENEENYQKFLSLAKEYNELILKFLKQYDNISVDKFKLDMNDLNFKNDFEKLINEK